MSQNTKVLLVDAGNTRIKWAIYRTQEKALESTHAQDYQDSSWSSNLRQLIESIAFHQVLLCNVAGETIPQIISAICAENGTALRVLANGQMALGLRQTHYLNNQQLGVDRCLLMVGARVAQPTGRLCVVSCGTALTIDVLDETGMHKGGIISASPRAIRQKLLENAAQINIDIDLAPDLIKMDSVYTQSTEQALYNGSAQSAIELVKGVWRRVQDEDPGMAPMTAWHLLYTGGGVTELLPYLPEQGVYYPNLLMTGLAAIADT